VPKPRGALVKKNGEAVAEKPFLHGTFTGTDGSRLERAAVDLPGELLGQPTDVLGDVAKKIAGTDAGRNAVWEGTGLADVIRSPTEMKSESGKEGADFLFLLLKGELREETSEILDRIYMNAVADGGDADEFAAFIEDVLAMAGRAHPGVLDFRRGFGEGDIFRGKSEVQARIVEARSKVGLARELMGNGAHTRHHECVMAGGAGEMVVPTEGRNVALGALAIGGVEEEPLVGVGTRGAVLRSQERAAQDEPGEYNGRKASGEPHR